MSQSQSPISQPRSSLLDGFLTSDALVAELGISEKTLGRREAEGMPCVHFGGIRLYPIALVRKWLLSRVVPPLTEQELLAE